MKKGGLTWNICEVIRLAGKELNAHQIVTELEERGFETNIGSFKSTISKHNSMFIRRQTYCPCCGHVMIFYRLSDEAKMRLAELKRGEVEPNISEYQDIGIQVERSDEDGKEKETRETIDVSS